MTRYHLLVHTKIHALNTQTQEVFFYALLCEHIISVRRKLHMTTGPRGGTYTLTKKYTCLCVTRPWAHRPARRGALHTRTDRTHIYAHIHTYVYLLRPGARGRGHGGCRRAHGSHALSSLGEDDLAVGVRIALHLLLLVRRVLDGHLADDDHPFVELDLTALDDELLALEERG